MGENANKGAASTNLSCTRARVYMHVNVNLHTWSVSMCMLDCVGERDKGSGARKLRGERKGEYKYIDTDAGKLLACGYDQAARLRIR
jgi:hypothetical protein